MTQKLKTIIFATALAALAACSDDVATGQFTVGDDDNLVCLSTGVQSAPSAAMQSRAALDGHYALQDGTAINLYVEGDWTGKDPSNIVKTPVYSAVKDDDADNINAITRSSGDYLYWDDFGTADPDNTANRTKGLGILAVAIDGVKSATSVPEAAWLSDDSSNDLQWTVTTDGTTSFKNDLLVANNLYHVSDATPIYRYTFDEQKELASKPEEARLDFKHVLSKITFKLTAGKGFTDIHGNPGFLDTPIVTLTRNKTGESNPEWCYTSGTVNIKTAKATNNGPLSLSKVVLDDIDRTGAIVTEEAIIFPESAFGDNDAVIAQINSFGNVYYITAEKIRKAIYDLGASHEHASKYYTLPGYNYIFNITVNKTDVVVTATITDWKTVTATEDIPEILPMATISWGNGGGTAADLKEFKFYSSYYKDSEYNALATAKCDDGANGTTPWTFYDASETETKLYWPSHNTHLFFRGISPSSTTVNDQKEIAISNAKYTKGTNAANLLIGMPEISSGTMCDNPDHEHIDMSVNGICARKEPINLNFRYMMSQVEVDLKTTSGADKVAIGENTVVEITNAYSSGVVSLGTREVTVSGSTGNYTLDADAVETDADKKKLQRRSAIVPQPLEGLKFKVTVTNDNGTKDVYYSTIKDIRVESNTITKWEPGYHYKYTLTLKKTGISVTATITDWITASGSDNVWM